MQIGEICVELHKIRLIASVADKLIDIGDGGRILVNLPVSCQNARYDSQDCDDLTAGDYEMAVLFPSFLEFFEFHK